MNNKANVQILIDSSADLSAQECASLGLEMVSMNVNIGGEEHVDGVTLSKDAFYALLCSSEEFPKTSQPSPELFAARFEQAKADGTEVVCILLSSSLSGTCQSAHLAKDMAGCDNVCIVDSLSATAGIRLLAMHALRMAQNGACAAEIASALEELKGRIRICAALDTLEYLAKGGRLGKAAANIGTMFHLKPVITVTGDGEVDVIDKQIGKVRAMQSVLAYLADKPADPAHPLYTVYADSPANTELLEKRMADAGLRAPDERVQIGPTIGAHVGPGAYGVIYIEA